MFGSAPALGRSCSCQPRRSEIVRHVLDAAIVEDRSATTGEQGQGREAAGPRPSGDPVEHDADRGEACEAYGCRGGETTDIGVLLAYGLWLVVRRR